MEEEMVNGAEIAGKLFQEAGIPNSARFCWSLASHFYAETFNAGRLSHVYQQMSLVIANQVPSVDTSSSMELSSPLGRFYRVWFHGSAPDGLVGAQFVYRANCNVKIGDFGKIVKKVMSALISDVHIDLVLDDGRHDANDGSAATTKRKHYISRPSQRKAFNVSRNEQPVNVGVCQIKVTPLRPILKQEEEIRGSPAWFSKHTETENYSTSANETEAGANDNREVGRRNQSYFAGRKNRNFYSTQNGGKMDCTNKDIIGVNTFTFTQPLEKDKRRGGRDWLRASSGFAEKSLRVTKLKVEKSLPTCVTRAPVAIRTVFNQSPLEAGIEAVCRWCAVLFRTAVAANGISVLGTSNQHGIGTAATKVVADSIHHSRIKDIGKELLTQTNYAVTEEEDENGENIAGLSKYERLSDAEVIKFKMRLARGILLFMELLHVLITRNRDLLLAVIRDKNYGGKSVGHQTPINLSPADQSRGNMSVCSESVTDSPSSKASVYTFADEVSVDDHSMFSSTSGRKQRKPDAGIMIQRELQKRYTAMARVLHPLILTVLKDETPQWLKDCCSDSYFKLGIYWETNVSMGEELFFGRSNANNLMRDQRQPRLTFRGSKSPSQLGNDTMMSNEITTPSLSKKKANAHHPSDTYKPGGSPIESSFEID